MSRRPVALVLTGFIAFLAAVVPAQAENFKTPSQCVAGKRVTDMLNRNGTVIELNQTTMCRVRFDDGKTENLLFWMLHPAGGSRETNDKLVPGKYECFAGGRYTFMDMYITGPHTYRAAGMSGTFVVLPSRQIIFQSGSLKPYHAKLLAGPTIGLNQNGSSFYATTCELKK